MAKKPFAATPLKVPTPKEQKKVLTDETPESKPKGYKGQLQSDADAALTAFANNGTGSERKNIPFRPYEETRLVMVRLATDLTEQRGELVKVHDIMIEAMNDYFKKHNVDHVARRPTRAKK